MGAIHKTGCVLCAQNCGLEAEVEDNRIVKVRPDKSNVRSEGYCCRTGLSGVERHVSGSSDWRYRPEATRPRHEMVAQCPVAGTAGGASGKTTAWPDEVALMDETH